jgi:hypothetical protein
MLPGYHVAKHDTDREGVVSKAFDSAKKAIVKHGNDKTPPRGTMSAMTRRVEIFHGKEKDSILAGPLGLRLKNQGYNMAATYKHVVDDEFENIWEEQLAAAVAVPVDDQTNSLLLEEKPSLQYRTCNLPLSRILRQEFCKNDIDHIHDLFDHSQEALSAHMAEIQTAILKAHAEVKALF